MWRSTKFEAAIALFRYNDMWPEGIYESLPAVLEETIAFQGDFDGNWCSQGQRLVTAFKEYTAFLRETSIEQVAFDRVGPNSSKGKERLDACLSAFNVFTKTDAAGATKLHLMLQGMIPALFTRSVTSYLSAFVYWVASDEEFDPDLKAQHRQAALYFCDDTDTCFKQLYEYLAELHSGFDDYAGADLVSFAISAVLGIAPQKFFNAVVDFAKGESPHFYARKTKAQLEGLNWCQAKAKYLTTHIRAET